MGATQLSWLKQELLNAQAAGTIWKFISVSDPIDQIGPIGGALASVTAAAMQPYSGNLSYGPVNADGGKSYIGGYRAERNALLKFIADNHIANVVFLATDDHQNRINELTYSPSGNTENQASYVKVPTCFSIVCGPLGATGPDLFLNHDFNSIKGAADLLANAQSAAGLEPIGLQGYPGLRDLVRDGDPAAGSSPTAADFYSPDTFNYNIMDVSPDGLTLSVTSFGMSSTPQNSAKEYNSGPQAYAIFSFKVDTDYVPTSVQVTRGGFVYNRRNGLFEQQVKVKNTGTAPIPGNLALILDGLGSNATLSGAAGTTANFGPLGSPYVNLPLGADDALTPGESITLVLGFSNPTKAAITYTPRTLAGDVHP